MTSGAIQNTLPLTLFMQSVMVVSRDTLLAPKSASFTTPSRLMRMLPPLRSRWTTLGGAGRGGVGGGGQGGGVRGRGSGVRGQGLAGHEQLLEGRGGEDVSRQRGPEGG